MKKILHLLSSTAYGGRELYVATLIKALAAAGVDVSAYVLPESRVYDELDSAKIKVYPAYNKRHFSPKDIMKVKEIISSNKINTLHSHSRIDVWTGSFAVIGNNCRHIQSIYMGASNKKDILHKLIYSQVDGVVSSALSTNREIAWNYPVRKERIHLVRYGRDISLYRKDEGRRRRIREKFSSDNDKVVVGFMGRIDKGKGVKEFAQSILFLAPEVREKVIYWIMGEPTIDYYNEGVPVYEKQSEDLNNWLIRFIMEEDKHKQIRRINFQKDYIPYLDAMDIFVLPSHDEMYSLSVIDALLMELPVIGTNRGGTVEQIGENERGILIEPKDPKAIADAISFYVNNETERKKAGLRGKRWAEAEHSMERMIKSLVQIY
jgi:D-inositol-3-phosphate glycosyltransferase